MPISVKLNVNLEKWLKCLEMCHFILVTKIPPKPYVRVFFLNYFLFCGNSIRLPCLPSHVWDKGPLGLVSALGWSHKKESCFFLHLFCMMVISASIGRCMTFLLALYGCIARNTNRPARKCSLHEIELALLTITVGNTFLEQRARNKEQKASFLQMAATPC